MVEQPNGQRTCHSLGKLLLGPNQYMELTLPNETTRLRLRLHARVEKAAEGETLWSGTLRSKVVELKLEK